MPEPQWRRASFAFRFCVGEMRVGEVLLPERGSRQVKRLASCLVNDCWVSRWHRNVGDAMKWVERSYRESRLEAR